VADDLLAKRGEQRAPVVLRQFGAFLVDDRRAGVVLQEDQRRARLAGGVHRADVVAFADQPATDHPARLAGQVRHEARPGAERARGPTDVDGLAARSDGHRTRAQDVTEPHLGDADRPVNGQVGPEYDQMDHLLLHLTALSDSPVERG
jgi:hypothetical protein